MTVRLDLVLTVAGWLLAIGLTSWEVHRNRGAFVPAIPFWGCLTCASAFAATLAYWLPLAFGARP